MSEEVKKTEKKAEKAKTADGAKPAEKKPAQLNTSLPVLIRKSFQGFPFR